MVNNLHVCPRFWLYGLAAHRACETEEHKVSRWTGKGKAVSSDYCMNQPSPQIIFFFI